MAIINPEADKKSFTTSPIFRVSGIFKGRDKLDPIVDALANKGFQHDQIEIFHGDEGAVSVSPEPKNANAVVRLVRKLELALSDETQIHDKISQTLSQGGMVIDVFTGGGEDRKGAAAAVLKSFDADEVHYWGRWSIERL